MADKRGLLTFTSLLTSMFAFWPVHVMDRTAHAPLRSITSLWNGCEPVPSAVMAISFCEHRRQAAKSAFFQQFSKWGHLARFAVAL